MAATANRRALSLYKAVLRAHQRYLPHEMRQLGDAYVKSEVSEARACVDGADSPASVTGPGPSVSHHPSSVQVA